MPLKFNPRVLYTLASALIIILGAMLAIEYAKGNYRITRRGFVSQSGLLSTNSFPTGGEVYIDGKLVTATDDTLYLEPGTYQIEIIKDGYWPWKKEVRVEEELVTQTNAQLFPIAPSLAPLTFSGADTVIPSPDGTKLLFVTSNANSASKNGLYVMELTDSFLSLQRGSRQIAQPPSSFDLATANFIWSPDSTQIMILSPERELLIGTDRVQELDTQPDISFRRKQILTEWEEEMYIRERQFLREFPEEMIAIATTSAQNVYISPDKKRLLYTATQEVTLPDELVPPIPATNTQPEERTLKPGTIYVYDREEDRNFVIGQEREDLESPKHLLATDLYNRTPRTLESTPSAFQTLQQNATLSAQIATNFNRYHTALSLNTAQWFPDSKHILYTTDSSVQIKGYDNTNDTSVYSGPFINDFVYPWPDGSKLVILTSFSPESGQNLYAIELKR